MNWRHHNCTRINAPCALTIATKEASTIQEKKCFTMQHQTAMVESKRSFITCRSWTNHFQHHCIMSVAPTTVHTRIQTPFHRGGPRENPACSSCKRGLSDPGVLALLTDRVFFLSDTNSFGMKGWTQVTQHPYSCYCKLTLPSALWNSLTRTSAPFEYKKVEILNTPR